MKRFLAVVLMSLLLPARALPSPSVLVFAAASLTDSLQEIARKYQSETGASVSFNFGASSILARQIQEGAPADIFFSADEVKMDALEKRGMLAKGSRRTRLSNTLAIIVSRDQGAPVRSPADLAEARFQRIALADPKTVPAGIYASEYFKKLGLWERIAPKVIPVDNVRAALAAVESGDADAGVVYKTDAALSAKIKTAFLVPQKEGPDIRYPMALLKDAGNAREGEKFLKFLESDRAGAVFEKFGFIVLK
jgi:molybdate transport system substrate-binding protein